MKRLGWMFTGVMLCATASAQEHRQQAQSWAPGTYSIMVCRGGPCTDSTDRRLVARGVLVLGASPELLASLPDSLFKVLRPDFSLQPGNGCFELTKARRGVGSYAGIQQRAGLVWISGDSGRAVEFDLYRSPDASHRVVLRPSGESLFGRGKSSGAGIASVHSPADTVIARRLGPPDRAVCEGAAHRELRYLARLRASPPNGGW